MTWVRLGGQSEAASGPETTVLPIRLRTPRGHLRSPPVPTHLSVDLRFCDEGDICGVTLSAVPLVHPRSANHDALSQSSDEELEGKLENKEKDKHGK